MILLQIRRKSLVETNVMHGVTQIRLEPNHIDNTIAIHFGMTRTPIEIDFAKKDYDRTVRLYNELLSAIDDSEDDYYYGYLRVDFDENNCVDQWWWSDESSSMSVDFPDRKYKVGIEYAFHVDVAVDAKDEAEAERKAQKMVNCGQIADEVNEAVGGANVIECHAEEIK